MANHASMWNPEYEALPREELRALQGERLREQVKHVYRNSSFFEELYDEHGIHPNDITGREDIEKLPVFDKDDLREYRDRTGDFWCGALCVPESEVGRATQSTGTTGKPNYFGLTDRDHDHVGEIFARQMYAWGFRKGDKFNQMGTAHWNGTVMALDEAARQIGVTPVNGIFGAQNIAEIIFGLQTEADFDAVLVYQPETELEFIRENDIDPTEVFPNVRFVFSMVDASQPKRELWEETWGVPFYNGYASGDQFFTSYECGHDGQYCHVPEDKFLVEVLDPETGEHVEPGEYGEVHITNLWAEANPYIRYRLEDLVDYKVGECDCGRTTMRIRPLGRLSWSVEVEGRERPVTNIEVEEVIWGFDELMGENYQIVKREPGEQSELVVRVATEADVDSDTRDAAEAALSEAFGVPAELIVTTSDAIGLESATKMERVAEEY